MEIVRHILFSAKEKELRMNYSAPIRTCDIANGDGCRVSMFVSGCRHHCFNCFNQCAWDFDYGVKYDESVAKMILEALKSTWCSGFSALGGEPMEVENQRELVKLFKAIKEAFPHKTIWCYTGCVLEKELLTESKWRCEVTDEMLSYVDVLVDGRYEDKRRDLTLAFRGSSNQRVIRDLQNVIASFKEKKNG